VLDGSWQGKASRCRRTTNRAAARLAGASSKAAARPTPGSASSAMDIPAAAALRTPGSASSAMVIPTAALQTPGSASSAMDIPAAALQTPGSASCAMGIPDSAASTTLLNLPEVGPVLTSWDVQPAAATTDSDTDDDNSGIIMCLVKGNLGKVTFTSSSLTQLVATRLSSPMKRVELLSDYDSGVVFLQWDAQVQFDQFSLREFLTKWIQDEIA
jgi:hypothetical protein